MKNHCFFYIIFLSCILLGNGCSDNESADNNTNITINIKDASIYEIKGQVFKNQVELNDFFHNKISKKHDQKVVIQGFDKYTFSKIKPVLTTFAQIGLYEIGFLFSSEKKKIFYLELPFGGTRAGQSVQLAVLSDKYKLNGGQPMSFTQLKKQMSSFENEVVWVDLSISDDVKMTSLVNLFMFANSKKLRLAWDY